MEDTSYIKFLLEKILELNDQIYKILMANHEKSNDKTKIDEIRLRELNELATKKISEFKKKMKIEQN